LFSLPAKDRLVDVFIIAGSENLRREDRPFPCLFAKTVIIHNGRIIEQGTHAELIAKQGMYYDLYRTGFKD
jgi:hypothetical protein